MMMITNILNGLFHGCLVHFANIAKYTSLFATELNVSNEITSKLQNHSFLSPKHHLTCLKPHRQPKINFEKLFS